MGLQEVVSQNSPKNPLGQEQKPSLLIKLKHKALFLHGFEEQYVAIGVVVVLVVVVPDDISQYVPKTINN